jgi:hypothetical protein
MALRRFLSLRRPRSGRLEGRTVLIQPASAASVTSAVDLHRTTVLRGTYGERPPRIGVPGRRTGVGPDPLLRN